MQIEIEMKNEDNPQNEYVYSYENVFLNDVIRIECK